MDALDWKRSSFCGGGGNNCVEIAMRDQDRVAVRDSVHPAQTIEVSRAALTAFITGVRTGKVDEPDAPA
ncbi:MULTISPECIES: DUF397 domain-containing protein [Streptomyces]|uniref:DUF397 domain-containing protein n=1 Tax=Streptomyces xinghaiensis TaxID=1038928 RepID=A0A3M8FB48_9ACTN|nr:MULTISPECIES: DUF397 domain-containing protein [Streptomyces]OFA61448.1 hypothetical protein BEN35_01380 [Streptomyces fradiae]PQM24414.1 DUF397 domain-containing protein [Streptomyces xinghaiensis]RKM98082.1 DUF397 domain-containing protein [Streptomyces xinghaiensis]RNC75223.1 DUF397 domain-containing protein [Streptomyces xinghaiensis]